MYSYVLKIIQKELCKSKKKLKVQISISINLLNKYHQRSSRKISWLGLDSKEFLCHTKSIFLVL